MEEDEIDRWGREWSWADYELRLDAMAVSKRITLLARRLEELATATLGPLGLDRGEYDVLAALLRSGPPHRLTPTVLTRSLMLSGGGLTKRLARLEERGLITREAVPGDRRSLPVILSPAGRDLTERAVAAHSTATAAIVDGMGTHARDQLSALLRNLLLVQERSERPGAGEDEPGQGGEEPVLGGVG